MEPLHLHHEIKHELNMCGGSGKNRFFCELFDEKRVERGHDGTDDAWACIEKWCF